MATADEIANEIASRIKADIKHFKGNLPERYSLAWHGYIASLYEWSFISQESYAKLFNYLPPLSSPNPVAEIFEGRDDED